MVFVSNAPGDSTLIKPLEADIVLNDPEKAMAAIRRGRVGEPLDDDMFPASFHGDRHSKQMKRLPHLFHASGFWCVSGPARAILETAELGRTRLRPVRIFQRDRVTPAPGDFHCLAIAETKHALDPDGSDGLRRNPHARTAVFNLPFVMTADAVSVSACARQGAELWLDPALQMAFFVSGRLGDALADAGLARDFRLYACRLAG